MSKKIAAFLTVVMFSVLAMTSVYAATLSISTPDYGIRNMTLTVTVLFDGTPVQGADVYFVLNNGTPVHGKTNESGKVNYKPLLTGILNITAIYNGVSTSKEIPIYEPVYGVNLTVDGKKTASKTIYTTETATYTLIVRNTGNVTDTINLSIGEGEIGTLSNTSVRLNPGENKTVTLEVSSNTAGNYTTTVTATSVGDPSKSDSVTVTTIVRALITPTPSPSPTPTPYRRARGVTVDSDGDGYSDSYEIRMGTDPYDPMSYPGAPTPKVTPTPSPSPSPTPTPTPILTPTPPPPGTPMPTPTPTPTPSPSPSPTPPGFEAIFAVACLLAIAYLALRRRM